MPDAGSRRPSSQGWSGAFAALPLEAPPPGGWARVAAALPGRRPRWPAWIAVAAALALVAVVPLRLARDGDGAGPARPVAGAPGKERARIAGDTGAAIGPQAPAATEQPDGMQAPAASARIAASEAAAPSPLATPGDAASPRNDGRGHPSDTAEHPRVVAAVETDRVTSPATDAPQPGATTDTVAAAAGAPAGASATDAGDAELERLYAESAQLEALLALARGDGVANGAAAALADELDARVAGIDAVLGQPALPSARRVALWRERVDALRQAAAFESTQRLLAARGEQYDAMLVSID